MKTVPVSSWTALLLLLPLPGVVGSQSHEESRNLRPRVADVQTEGRFQEIAAVSVLGGAEFDQPDSYQNRALKYVRKEKGLTMDDPEFLEYYGLACLFYATNGVHNKHTISEFGEDFVLQGWLDAGGWVSTDTDKCAWFGVSCNSDNQVLAIQLASNNLMGTFPPEIVHLGKSLEIIDIYFNTYCSTEGDAGNAWMGQLPNIRQLLFRSTSFEYAGIPAFWADTPTLEQIDCSNTFFTNGPIRASAFRGLPALFYLDIGGNMYTTGLPETLLTLPSLTNFYMPEAMFLNDKMSLSFVTRMPVLAETWVDFTTLDGGIPVDLGSASRLTSLSAIFCELDGTIPAQLALLSGMQSLFLLQNNLIGEIPTELGSLVQMKALYLEGNNLEGAMPDSICFNRVPVGDLEELGADCQDGGTVDCACCTCCGEEECGDLDFL